LHADQSEPRPEDEHGQQRVVEGSGCEQDAGAGEEDDVVGAREKEDAPEEEGGCQHSSDEQIELQGVLQVGRMMARDLPEEAEDGVIEAEDHAVVANGAEQRPGTDAVLDLLRGEVYVRAEEAQRNERGDGEGGEGQSELLPPSRAEENREKEERVDLAGACEAQKHSGRNVLLPVEEVEGKQRSVAR
jgi:hypothetical protein